MENGVRTIRLKNNKINAFLFDENDTSILIFLNPL